MITNIIAIALAAIATFIFFGPLPISVKLIWTALFVLFWLMRKFIQENVISFLQSKTVTNSHSADQPQNFWDKIESLIWSTDSGEKTSSDQWKYKRSPNQESLKLIRHLISLLILIVFIGIPGLIFGVISFIGAILDKIGMFFTMIGDDLAFANGIGFFFGAILEAITTLVALVLATFCIVKKISFKDFKSDYCCVIFGKAVRCKNVLIITIITVLLQRITSWFYFEYTFMDVLGEVVRFTICVMAVAGFAFIRHTIRKHRTSTPLPSDSDDTNSPF